MRVGEVTRVSLDGAHFERVGGGHAEAGDTCAVAAAARPAQSRRLRR